MCHFPVNENYSHHPSHHHNLGHTWLPTLDYCCTQDRQKRTSDTCVYCIHEKCCSYALNVQKAAEGPLSKAPNSRPAQQPLVECCSCTVYMCKCVNIKHVFRTTKGALCKCKWSCCKSSQYCISCYPSVCVKADLITDCVETRSERVHWKAHDPSSVTSSGSDSSAHHQHSALGPPKDLLPVVQSLVDYRPTRPLCSKLPVWAEPAKDCQLQT